MSSNKVNELTTNYVTLEFLNRLDVLEAPLTARYRIDCLTEGVNVLGWTTIPSPSSSEVVAITSNLNAIIDAANNSFETKQITVEAYYGVNDFVYDEIEYDVVAMSQVPPV